jgi:hypothetical protein
MVIESNIINMSDSSLQSTPSHSHQLSHLQQKQLLYVGGDL